MWPPWKEGERDPMSSTPHGVHLQVLTWCLGLSGGPEQSCTLLRSPSQLYPSTGGALVSPRDGLGIVKVPVSSLSRQIFSNWLPSFFSQQAIPGVVSSSFGSLVPVV